MKQANVFLVVLTLTLLAFFPAVARADKLDDLEVTMEVLDDASDLEAAMSTMRGPDDDEVEDEDWEDEEEGQDEDESDERSDGVEDEDDESEEDELEDESDDDFDDDCSKMTIRSKKTRWTTKTNSRTARTSTMTNFDDDSEETKTTSAKTTTTKWSTKPALQG